MAWRAEVPRYKTSGTAALDEVRLAVGGMRVKASLAVGNCESFSARACRGDRRKNVGTGEGREPFEQGIAELLSTEPSEGALNGTDKETDE